MVVVIVALFVPNVCPVKGGGGYMEYIRKALEKGNSEHLGSASCTDDMFEIFVHFGRGLCCLLPLFVNKQLPCPHINSLHGLLLPLMRHRNLWKRARFGGVKWVQVSWDERGMEARKPRTSRSQQPACTHKEHQILTSAKATAFVA